MQCVGGHTYTCFCPFCGSPEYHVLIKNLFNTCRLLYLSGRIYMMPLKDIVTIETCLLFAIGVIYVSYSSSFHHLSIAKYTFEISENSLSVQTVVTLQTLQLCRPVCRILKKGVTRKTHVNHTHLY